MTDLFSTVSLFSIKTAFRPRLHKDTELNTIIFLPPDFLKYTYGKQTDDFAAILQGLLLYCCLYWAAENCTIRLSDDTAGTGSNNQQQFY